MQNARPPAGRPGATYERLKTAIPQEFRSFVADRAGETEALNFLLTAFVAFLARVCNEHEFDVGFSDTGLRDELRGQEGLLAAHAPLHLKVNCRENFTTLLPVVLAQVAAIARRRTYARDVVARYPLLRPSPDRAWEQLSTLVIECTRSLERYQPRETNGLAFVMPQNAAECLWVYHTSAVERDSVARMSGWFTTFLRGLASEPHKSIAELPLLDAEERHKLLAEWNNPRAVRPESRSIHRLFEEQVARTPDAVAVVFESGRLTYAELNRRANRVAHRLHRLRVGPEERVGILVERSPEMVIGLLGVLKAGGAYLPLDPRAPRDRLLFMMEEAGASILLTHSAFAGQLQGFAGTLIRLDAAEGGLAAEPEHNLSVVASPDNLMGLLYTSGSTGRPKATMITGRGFLNLCRCYRRYHPFTSQSRALLMMNFSFDAAFKNIVVPLLAGGKLILANPGYYDAAVLLRAIHEHEVTFINTTPSQMYPIVELAAASDYRELSSLECLMVGGEAMILPKFRRWLNQTDRRCRLVNVYGPAECSDVASLYEVKGDEVDTLQIVPAGRAIDSGGFYVLDACLNLLPAGVPGELCVSGEILSRGYWRRPDSTAEKFVPNPFAAGERMYRTGDRARWRADGQIEILGRMSEGQVKLRGMRVELGEIESALHRHASVREAVVVAHEDESKEKQLVAYLVPREAHNALAYSDLRDFLRQTLPEYMVPACFVMLESLPTNRNGKVDRMALPPPPRGRPPLGNAFAPPRDVFEQRLALIWEEVLNVQPVGVFDNFFELGGYSLLAAQLFVQIERLVGQTPPLSLLTQCPTIDEMAARLRRESHAEV
jgi:surfactin family lipopeptide synthetase A